MEIGQDFYKQGQVKEEEDTLGPIDGTYSIDGIRKVEKQARKNKLPLESLMKKTKGKKSQKNPQFFKKNMS